MLIYIIYVIRSAGYGYDRYAGYGCERCSQWNHKSSGIRQWIGLHGKLSRKFKGMSWCSTFPPHSSYAPPTLQPCFWAHTVILHFTYSQNLLSYPFPFKMNLYLKWLLLKIRRLEETSLEHPTHQWDKQWYFSTLC